MNLPAKIVIGVLGAASLVTGRMAADWVAAHTWRAHRAEHVATAAEIMRGSRPPQHEHRRPIAAHSGMPNLSRTGHADGRH